MHHKLTNTVRTLEKIVTAPKYSKSSRIQQELTNGAKAYQNGTSQLNTAEITLIRHDSGTHRPNRLTITWRHPDEQIDKNDANTHKPNRFTIAYANIPKTHPNRLTTISGPRANKQNHKNIAEQAQPINATIPPDKF